MVLKLKIPSWFVVILAVLLCVSSSAEPKRQHRPEIRRLVEMKTVDEKGIVRARIVAEYKPTEREKQTSSTPDAERTKGYIDDDEDSDSSSGDSARGYGESYDMDVANDEPMAPSANQSSSEASGQPFRSSSPINNNATTSMPVTSPVDSKTSTAVPTATVQSINGSSPTTIPTTAVDTTTQNTVITQKPATTGATVTTAKDNDTTLSTLSPITLSTKDIQNITTLPPKVTEVKTVFKSTTTMAATTVTPTSTEGTPTTAPDVTDTTPLVKASSTARSNFTDQGMSGNKSTVPTKAVPTTGDDTLMRGQKDPEAKAKRRKTLFGFVTVEILIALLAGALFSVLLVAFLVYRLKKRNEGSYELSETIALRPKEIDEMGKKKEVFV
jgi:hypothetical protein